jgi:hypothetical protein
MSESLAQIRIRGQLKPIIGAETDICVTKKSVTAEVIKLISRAVREHGFATVHATGAANYKALKIVVALQKACSGSLNISLSTKTLAANDFYLPTTSEETEIIKARRLNGVDIRITRVAEDDQST